MSFPLNVFQPLIKLEELSIDIPCSYIDKQLKWLTSIKNLFLHHYPNEILGKEFTSLGNLKELNIEGPFSEISSKFFNNLKHSSLRKLKLRSRKLTVVRPSTFTSFKHLESLDLYGNGQFCGQGLFNITVGLNCTNIRVLSVRGICNKEWDLEPKMVENLRETHLEDLDLSLSCITNIYQKVYENLPRSLRCLNLRLNHLFDLGLPSLYVLENLRHFDISFNFNRIHMEISESSLSGFPHNYKSRQTTQRISDTKVLPTKNRISDLALTLGHKILSGSEVSSIAQFDVTERRKQKLLHSSLVQDNTKDDKCYTLPFRLETIDLRYSEFLYLVTRMFCGTNNSLKVIDASDQYKGYLREYGLGKLWKRMKNIHSLETLKLNGNEIKKIPSNVFSKQTHLKSLTLSNNLLIDAEFDIQTLFRLELLDLSDNMFEYLPSQFSQHIENIAKHSNLTVYLHGNRLSCKCDQLDFVTWLLHTRVVFRKDNLTCRYKNGTELALSRISDIHMQLEAECLVLQVLLNSIFGFLTLLSALGFVSVIFHKRWRFRYLSLIGRRTINPYHPIEDRHILLEYDIYISYDRDHVVNSNKTLHELLTQRIYPSLRQRGLKVIIREELDMGKKLFDVISQALRKSRKVVVLLSKEYCRDHWNIFEFNMAVMEGIYTKREVVVPVMLGTLNLKDLHEEVYAFLRSVPVANFSFDRNVGDLINFLFESAR